MKSYTVIALSVGGLGKKIFNSGDTVYEDNFIPGREEELVKQGFLKPNHSNVMPELEIPDEPEPHVAPEIISEEQTTEHPLPNKKRPRK